MKQWFKVMSGLLIALVVVGSVTLLAVKYFDVLVRGFDALRDQVARKKAHFFGSECCDYDDEDELAAADDL